MWRFKPKPTPKPEPKHLTYIIEDIAEWRTELGRPPLPTGFVITKDCYHRIVINNVQVWEWTSQVQGWTVYVRDNPELCRTIEDTVRLIHQMLAAKVESQRAANQSKILDTLLQPTLEQFDRLLTN